MILVLATLAAVGTVEMREPVRPVLARARCSVGELMASPGYHYRPERVHEFVDSATLIVRVIAAGSDSLSITWPGTTDRPGGTRRVGAVSFRVEEVLRGELPSGRLTVAGELAERDDYNPRTVPYTIVRPGGQHGDCFARSYRVGAEYLLLLRDGPAGLAPYWQPLAPLNEQVRGATDPWVEWVRAAVRR
jgi:hypothetical protein